MNKIVLINAVGLTPRLLQHAPRLAKIAAGGWMTPLREVLPAVTCTAQATILTGKSPAEHGVVANGWLFRDTNEVRFWQQSNKLIQAEPLYVTAKRRAEERGRKFTTAKMFWWFNQGAEVDWSVTPKPWYGIDGNKAFDVASTPVPLAAELKAKLGSFPFPSFWGPMAGLPSTQWIANATAEVMIKHQPDLTLTYLPHLDYEPQRSGPSGCDMAKYVRELDDACEPVLDAAKRIGAAVWVVSEYGHCDVDQPIYINRSLRDAGLLNVRSGPFGEQLDLYDSRAYAVVDHQLAHVYVKHTNDIPRVRELLASLPGVQHVYVGEERAEIELNHERSGELIALSTPKAWFAYPFWQDDRLAPDYARCIAIHNKPGFDPCELYFDPKFRFPKLHAGRRLIQKKLGFRMKLDVVPLDAAIVRGSHGLRPSDPQDAAILIGVGPKPTGSMTDMKVVSNLLLESMNLL